jgi:cell division septum initiation protein DivIVA
MTDHTLARADEVLTELIELVETARTLPMSSSCVVPRERTLDLLDALRDVLPPELAEARRVVAQRDRTLSEADSIAHEQLRQAQEEAEAVLAAAQDRARTIVETAEQQAQASVSAADAQARELVEAGQREQQQLVSATSVQQAAVTEAARVRAEASQQAEAMLAEASQQAGALTAQAHDYAYGTLSELVDNLHRLAATAENGRAALGQPQPTQPPA